MISSQQNLPPQAVLVPLNALDMVYDNGVPDFAVPTPQV